MTLLLALVLALALGVWRFGAHAVFFACVSLSAAGLLGLTLLLYLPLTVRLAARFDTETGSPDSRQVDVSARYLFGAVRFDLHQPLPGETAMSLRLLGWELLKETA